MVCWCVLHRGQRGEGGVFRRLCAGVISGWDLYWFGVGRGCDVPLRGGRDPGGVLMY